MMFSMTLAHKLSGPGSVASWGRGLLSAITRGKRRGRVVFLMSYPSGATLT